MVACSLLPLAFIVWWLCASASFASAEATLSDTAAVIVCSSRFWHNYRHAANALSIYSETRRLGLRDSHIILMLADEWAYDARNPFPGTVFGSYQRQKNLYLEDIQVDYRGEDVSVESFLRVLTDEHPAYVPDLKRLRTGPDSTVLVYLTGHGGDGFLKFQDREELMAGQLAGALARMRFRRLLLAVDTCQAGEDSYSHHADGAIGVPIIDRFTFHLARFLSGLATDSEATLEQLAEYLRQQPLASTLSMRTDLMPEGLAELHVTDFFGAGSHSGGTPHVLEEQGALATHADSSCICCECAQPAGSTEALT